MPSFALLPALFSRPPITKVGSSPPSARTEATRLVVVVLPCVPATAMPWRKRMSSPSISARRTTGMRDVHAPRASSGFAGGDGRGHDDDARARDLPRRVADEDAHAHLREPRGHRVRAQVRALHRVAEVDEHLGDAAHAGAADADQVNEADAPHAVAHARPPSACEAEVGDAARGVGHGERARRLRHREEPRAPVAEERREAVRELGRGQPGFRDDLRRAHAPEPLGILASGDRRRPRGTARGSSRHRRPRARRRSRRPRARRRGRHSRRRRPCRR